MLAALVQALARQGGPVQVIETHISAVLLAGEFAYKLKKPVDLGFVDFTRRSARRHFCREELRLNRRLAPQLYLAVVPICGRRDAPRLGGDGRAIDYAVKMRRFPASAQFDRLLEHGQLRTAQLDALVARIAQFHAELPPAAAGSAFGRPADLRQAAWRGWPPGARLNTAVVAPCSRAAAPAAGCANAMVICTWATSCGSTGHRCRSTVSSSTRRCAGRTCTTSWPS
jgi:hypothetical protein